MKKTDVITREIVVSLLNYDPLTGIFRWKNDAGQGGRIRAGTKAGGLNSEGYWFITINNILCSAHRLAWLVTYGKWPEKQIDHINRVKDDNRIENLRDVTCAENVDNRSYFQEKINTSGFKNVSFDKNRGKWCAYLSMGQGRKKRIGRFETAEEANAALIELRNVI